MGRRRQRKEEIQLPAWVTQGEQRAMRERVLIPIPVKREEAKHEAHRYMDCPDDQRPWYLQDEAQQIAEEEQTWYGQLLTRLSEHVADLLYRGGDNLNIDEAINGWLNCNRDFYRAMLLGFLNEANIREGLSRQHDDAMVNAIIQIVLS
jgi:hypothetical protein